MKFPLLGTLNCTALMREQEGKIKLERDLPDGSVEVVKNTNAKEGFPPLALMLSPTEAN
jgi:hypothetical protein